MDMAEKQIAKSQKRICRLADELIENRKKFADNVPDFVELQDPMLQLADLELDDDDLDDVFGDSDDQDEDTFNPDDLLAQMEKMQQQLNELEEVLKQSDERVKEIEEQEQRKAMQLDMTCDNLLKKCKEYTPERKRHLESIAMSDKPDAEKMKEIYQVFLNSDFEKDSFWDVWEKAQGIVLKKYTNEDSLAPSFAWSRLFDLVTGGQDDAEKIKEIKKSFLNSNANVLWDVLDKAQTSIEEKYPQKDSFSREKAWDELVSLSMSDKSDAEKIKEIKKSFLNPEAWALLDVLETAQNTILKKYPDKSSFAQVFALIELKDILSSDKPDAEKIEKIKKSFLNPRTDGTSLWDVVQSAQESLLERDLASSEYSKLANVIKDILESGKSDEERIAEIQKQPQFRFNSLSELRHGILNDVADVARADILNRFPGKDSIAQKSAMNELERIISDDNTSIEKRITMLFSRFMEGNLAINQIIQSALRGDLAAQFRLAQVYANGTGFRKDADKARRWYLMAASKGHADAQAALGDIYLQKDTKEAAKWYLKAAERGNREAQYMLGNLYSDGKIDSSDPKSEAQKWYRQAADNGHVEAMFKCGRIREAAKEGHPEAMYMVALEVAAAQRYDLFAGDNAIEMFRKARQCGSKKASEVCSQYDKMREYAKAAKAGDPEAQYRMGLCYERMEGKGFSQMSLLLFTKAAQRKHEGAMQKLGARALSGIFSGISKLFKG